MGGRCSKYSVCWWPTHFKASVLESTDMGALSSSSFFFLFELSLSLSLSLVMMLFLVQRMVGRRRRQYPASASSIWSSSGQPLRRSRRRTSCRSTGRRRPTWSTRECCLRVAGESPSRGSTDRHGRILASSSSVSFSCIHRFLHSLFFLIRFLQSSIHIGGCKIGWVSSE